MREILVVYRFVGCDATINSFVYDLIPKELTQLALVYDKKVARFSVKWVYIHKGL